jgi:hypothetical protein
MLALVGAIALVTIFVVWIHRPTSSERAIDRVHIAGFHRVDLFVDASGTQSDDAEAIYVGASVPAGALVDAVSAPALRLQSVGGPGVSNWPSIENALFTGSMQESCGTDIAMLRPAAAPPKEWTLSSEDRSAILSGDTMVLDVVVACR